MPLGEGVARAMERDDARSPRPYTTINLTNQPLGDATGSGDDKRGRQGKKGGEGGGAQAMGRRDGDDGRGGGERKDAARAPRHDKQPGV